MSVYDATQESIEAAIAAGALDRVLSAGPVAALLALARKIDGWDDVVSAAMDGREDGERLPIPLHDNTSIPTYLKYCESLRLTPSTAVAVAVPKGRAVDELRNRRARKAKEA